MPKVTFTFSSSEAVSLVRLSSGGETIIAAPRKSGDADFSAGKHLVSYHVSGALGASFKIKMEGGKCVGGCGGGAPHVTPKVDSADGTEGTFELEVGK